MTLSGRTFAGGRVLWVWLGGQDGADDAVHLAERASATNRPNPPTP